MLEVE